MPTPLVIALLAVAFFGGVFIGVCAMALAGANSHTEPKGIER
jgi:hypothetical protein